MHRLYQKWLPLVPFLLFSVLYSVLPSQTDRILSGGITLEEWRLLHDSFSQRVIQAVKFQDQEQLKRIFNEAESAEVFPEWLLEYNHNILRSCQKNAILFTGNDLDTTAAWYLQQRGIRKDVSVIPVGLLNQNWFLFALVGPNHFVPTCPLGCSCTMFSDSTKFDLYDSMENTRSNAIDLIVKNNNRPVQFSINCDQEFLGSFHDQLIRYGMTWLKRAAKNRELPAEHMKILKNIYSGKKGFRSIRQTLSNPQIGMPLAMHLQYIDLMRQLYRNYCQDGNLKDAARIKGDLLNGIGKSIIFQPDF